MANNKDNVSFSVGGNTTNQSTNHKDAKVNVTGGFAKASPSFEPIIAPVSLPTPAEQTKALLNNKLPEDEDLLTNEAEEEDETEETA